MKFTLTTYINAGPENIYNSWLTSEKHSKMTGGSAEISNKVGTHFSAWDGYIEGEILELIPNSKILQSWRTSDFAENDEDSIVEISLKEFNGQTELTLVHTNLSEHGEQYKLGWENHYFQPMKEYFSKV